MYQNFIGIDISKYDFSVAVLGEKKTTRYTNDTDGFNAFVSSYQDQLKNGLVVLETTGGYELSLIYYLQQHQCAVHRANARNVKYFIRSLGTLAKTDAIDALGLALYAKERQATLELYKANSQEKLLKLVQRRIDLNQMLVQEKNRRQAPHQHVLKKSFDAVIKMLNAQIKEIENEIEVLFKADPLLAEKKKVLKEVNGIGDIVSIQLLALLPEIGTIDRKKIANLGGLAPLANDSGKRAGYRSTRGGRPGIKSLLFMAALTAARSQSYLGEFYNRLVKAGKKKMVALTALMRKILVIANAKLRDFLHAKLISQHG